MSVEKYHQQKIALGCTTTLVLVTDMPQAEIDMVFAKLWLRIFEFEKRFSRFLKYSELSLFNRSAGKKTPISPEFEDILQIAKQMANLTDNIYNPFVLPSLHKAGYTKSFIEKYDDDVIDYSHRFVVGTDHLKISNGYAEIPANTAIDLGGIGKGYLADMLSESEEVKGMAGYWFSFGGDVVGDGLDIEDKRWRVNVQSAISPKTIIDYHYISGGDKFAIATSGTITRRGVNRNNEKWHHIIDPSTLKPSNSDITLATVVADSACMADVSAKTAVILGSKKSQQYLKKHRLRSYILQSESGDVNVVGDFVDSTKTALKTNSKAGVK